MDKRATEPAFLVIGRIVRPHGVRGEMRVKVLSDTPERFAWLEEVYLARSPDDEQPEGRLVERARLHKDQALLILEGVGSREEAEALRGTWLLVPLASAVPLEEDEYYHFQLEGLEVFTDEGERLGTIREVLETGANEVFVLQGERGELLLPNIADVVQEVDLAQGRMVVHVLPGLL